VVWVDEDREREHLLCVGHFDLKGEQGRLAVEPSDPPPREPTIDEAIALAIQLQKQQHFAEAEQLYARVLDASPDHTGGLHYTGLLGHQQGRGDEAVALIAV